MIVLKEIKRKDYLKGTKALKVRHFLGIGFAFLFLLPGIPLYYRAQQNKPKVLEAKKKKEEAQMEKAKLVFQLRTLAWERQNHPDPHHPDKSDNH